jgi:hypothetical protein
LNTLNDNEIVRLDKIIQKAQQWRKMIIDTKNSNIDKARKYRVERTATPAESTTVTTE